MNTRNSMSGFVFNFLRPRRSTYGYHCGLRYAYR